MSFRIDKDRGESGKVLIVESRTPVRVYDPVCVGRRRDGVAMISNPTLRISASVVEPTIFAASCRLVLLE
jgi:hypothetical protein